MPPHDITRDGLFVAPSGESRGGGLMDFSHRGVFHKGFIGARGKPLRKGDFVAVESKVSRCSDSAGRLGCRVRRSRNNSHHVETGLSTVFVAFGRSGAFPESAHF